jgi:hypothetical protein
MTYGEASHRFAIIWLDLPLWEFTTMTTITSIVGHRFPLPICVGSIPVFVAETCMKHTLPLAAASITVLRMIQPLLTSRTHA